MKIMKIAENDGDMKYRFWKTCVDFEDGNDVQRIVDYDPDEYEDATYGHNPQYQISRQQFLQWTNDPTVYDFYGFNPDEGVVFGYDFGEDIHYFYIRDY